MRDNMEVTATCSHCGEEIEECDFCGQDFEPDNEIICITTHIDRPRSRIDRILEKSAMNAKEKNESVFIPEYLHLGQCCADLEATVEVDRN